jgi:nucleoside-diphosphate-sugar epimerase
MQQVLITGATGFIGSNLARALAQRGYRVKVLVRSTEKAVALLEGSQVHIVQGDITDPESLEGAVEPGDIVVHLAARYNDPAASYEMYRESNVVGTENLILACQAKLVRRFVHCSTIGIAINSGKPPFDENSPYSPDPAEPYEVTKCEGEQLVLKYYREQGFPAVVVRPVQPFGPGDLKKVKFYKLVKKGVVIGRGKVYKHLIYIADLVDAFEVAMCKDGIEGQVFIIGGKPVVTLAEMIRWAAEELNVKTPLRIPAFPIQILTAAVEAVCKSLKIKPPLYKSRLEFFTKSYYFDTSKAESLLGFEPQVSIREGMARTVDWYRQQGLL